MLLAVGLAASGCVQVRATISISAADQVSGDVVVAALPTGGQQGPALTIAPTLASRVNTTPYTNNGFVGEEITFHNLTFDELALLTTTISTNSEHYQLTLRRSGNQVSLAGSVDLTQVPAQNSDVRIKVSFPGTIVRTDGTAQGDTVSWQPQAGQVTTFGATAQYATAATSAYPWSFWALMIGLGGTLIAAFVTLLALWARRWNLRKEQQPV